MALSTSMTTKVPAGVECTIEGRKVTVVGPKGKLVRDFSHAPVDLTRTDDGVFTATVWFPRGRLRALPQTICTHVANMVNGVTKGYEYKMRLAYAHFPISATVVADNTVIELRNFMHETRTRRIECPPGVRVALSTAVKDEIILTGIDIEDVSGTAARIHRSLRVPGGKDLRKFLDGCYVSSRGLQE